MYKRVLLKLSGEQLTGKFDSGIDVEFCRQLADEVGKAAVADAQMAIMVGGGNYARGAQLGQSTGINRVTADNIGMLATMMNALALADIFKDAGLEAWPLSNIKASQVMDDFTTRRAVHHLENNRVVIVGGGIGRPYFTTDTAAVSLALELECNAVLKATKVDGVYDKDPAQFPDAKKVDHMSFQQSVADRAIRVMDKAALGLAMEHSLPIIVFDATVADNILKATQGEAVGTIIS